ncbi:uncharacterized protein JN550_000718 [Neoarthrinium moseri]|uniref:uncharacterized protein n=1 Tax=Neoarthrinium moseri TaxID=1658444 RepID=UPI001FDCF177|nr:uncharacterized protein JN550_000718 [Neoarthrinium moseri]KAI1878536.1 hypothetical protein JN550_000718 [Neoarthrinium moseri]
MTTPQRTPLPSNLNLLGSDNSRWKTRPTPYNHNAFADAGRERVLLYLQPAVGRRLVIPGDAFAAVNSTRKIGAEFHNTNPATRSTIHGNTKAATVLGEFDELITLTKYLQDAWELRDGHANDDWRDWMHTDVSTILGPTLPNGTPKRRILQQILSWAHSWIAVRFRYPDQHLDDDFDPNVGTYKYALASNVAQRRAWCEATNKSIHCSDLLTDAQLARAANFRQLGYATAQVHFAAHFQIVYGLSLDQTDEILGHTSRARHQSLRGLFTWLLAYANSFVTWRGAMLQSNRRERFAASRVWAVDSTGAPNPRHQNSQAYARDREPLLEAVDTPYRAMLTAGLALVATVTARGTITRAEFTYFDGTVTYLN